MEEAEAELAKASAQVTEHGVNRATVERDQQRAMAKRAMAKATAGRGHAI